jgi:hypothetical protein
MAVRETLIVLNKILILLMVGFLAAACTETTEPNPSGSSALREGDSAPGFTLESPTHEVSLDDYRGKKPVLLYFSMGPG